MTGKNGVTDGARTHDHQDHNPGLYQLSYSHHSLLIWRRLAGLFGTSCTSPSGSACGRSTFAPAKLSNLFTVLVLNKQLLK
jgi:hypothetical protein